jgi:hypothetical protein
MKCDLCSDTATHHVTERVSGKCIQRHRCEAHADENPPPAERQGPVQQAGVPGEPDGTPETAISIIHSDPELQAARRDEVCEEKLTAFLLPAYCLALQDQRPEVRISAIIHISNLNHLGVSLIGALQDRLQDPDKRVQRAAQASIDWLTFVMSEPDKKKVRNVWFDALAGRHLRKEWPPAKPG